MLGNLDVVCNSQPFLDQGTTRVAPGYRTRNRSQSTSWRCSSAAGQFDHFDFHHNQTHQNNWLPLGNHLSLGIIALVYTSLLDSSIHSLSFFLVTPHHAHHIVPGNSWILMTVDSTLIRSSNLMRCATERMKLRVDVKRLPLLEWCVCAWKRKGYTVYPQETNIYQCPKYLFHIMTYWWASNQDGLQNTFLTHSALHLQMICSSSTAFLRSCSRSQSWTVQLSETHSWSSWSFGHGFTTFF